MDTEKFLFIGIQVSSKLQRELDNCPRGTERYFKESTPESLEIVTFGDEKIIGRFLPNGFPVNDLDNVRRNVCSIVAIITQGHRITENSVRIYAAPGAAEYARASVAGDAKHNGA